MYCAKTNCHFFLFYVCTILSLYAVNVIGVQPVDDTRYVISGDNAVFSCPPPGSDSILKWRFRQNGSQVVLDVAQNFFGLVTIFNQFDLPPGRTSLTRGLLNISNVGIPDEGEYWCELSSAGDETVLSHIYPMHVYVKPQEPQLSPKGRQLVQENTADIKIATCESKGGKPAAKLSWWNGTVLLANQGTPVVEKNFYNHDLSDTRLDLVVHNWTRFDHRRNFTCKIEHPAYQGLLTNGFISFGQTLLHQTVNQVMGVQQQVHYSDKLQFLCDAHNAPVNARIWANLTSLTVYCHADGFREPSYSWILPGGTEQGNTSTLQMPNLFSIDGNQFFRCTSDNGIPPAAVVEAYVEDLRYPDGRPEIQFLGLSIWIWVAIGGGLLLLIIVAIIVIYCCCCKKKKDNGYTAKYSKPTVKESSNRHSQPSLLDHSMRTPDGRESSLPPKEYPPSKVDMTRAYSLEQLTDRKFGGDPRSSVTLVPLKGGRPRNDLYNDASLNRRASREEIDKVADHIEVLNQSWDNLVRSREHLNRSREELRDDPPRYRSHDDLRQSRGNIDNRDNYPYMDDTVDGRRHRDATPSYSNQNYYQHEIIPQAPFDHRNTRDAGRTYNEHQHRDRYDDSYRGGRSYDDDYRGNHAYDDDYRGNRSYGDQSYNDGYGASSGGYNQQNSTSNRDYDDRRNYDQNYSQRQASYGDSEFDDEPQDGYNDQYGYQPASMI